MKKFYLPLLTLLMSFISIDIFAFDIEVANDQGVTIYYNFINDNTELSVTSGSYFNKYSGNVVIPESVKYNGNSYSVTSIDNYAFSCSDLTSITIPNSVTSIGCLAFSYCTDLTSITIPNSVVSIDSYAFSGCRGLTSIVIPQSVTSISYSAFRACDGLTSIRVESGNPNYDSRNDCNAIIQTSSNSLISGCKNTIIPNSVSSLGYGAFDGCSGLTSITIPNSVTTIDTYAFANCTSLTSMIIPNSVTSIGDWIFDNCSGLTSVTIGSGVTSIGIALFNSCNVLTSIKVESGNSKYDSRDDCNAIIETSTNTLIRGCKSTIIPNSVTSIGEYAFEYYSDLTSITIPNSVTSISYSVFNGCINLASITIPSSVTSIGYQTFQDCNLESVTVNRNEPITISSDVFSNRRNAILYVPKGCKAAYETADYWKEFKEIRELDGNSEDVVFCYRILSKTDKTAEVIAGENKYSGNLEIPSSVEIDNVTYSVIGIGNSAFRNCTGLTSITIPNSVTSIGNATFTWCSGLTSVTIPNSVTSIGSDAFSRCSGLTSITIPNSVNEISAATFKDCNSLTSVSIPNSVTSIGHLAFSGCKSLAFITIPNGVTLIDYNAFYECESLTSITISNSVTSIGYQAFDGCKGLTSITIPNSVTSIGNRIFGGCSDLTSVTIGSGVTSIGILIFENCNALTSIKVESDNPIYDSRDNCNAIIETSSNSLISGCKNTIIPNSVTSIGRYAFYSCRGLTSVTIPNSVTSIDKEAFKYCNDLNSVTANWNEPITISSEVFSNRTKIILYVPKGCKAAYEAADYWKEFKEIKEQGDSSDAVVFCYKIISKTDKTAEVIAGEDKYSGNLEVPSSVEIDNVTYSVIGIGNSAFRNCTGLTSITIPNSVTSIGGRAFEGCSGLISITIPNSVTSIGSSAFNGCSGLTSVIIPNSLKKIGEATFKGCNSLTSVSIPNSVTSIVNQAFSGCKSLASITIPNGVTSIGYQVFYECESLTSISISNSVTSIGDQAFSRCKGLTSITIPNSVTSIGNHTFKECSDLTSVTIGSGVTSIGSVIFEDCNALTSIKVESDNPKYDSRDNCNAIIETSSNSLISGCKNTIIPNSVTSIGNCAFYGCMGLTSVTIPNNVTSIDKEAFYGCKDLASITIGSGVTSIGFYAFGIVHDSPDVYCMAENVPNTNSDAFHGTHDISKATLHVPSGSLDAYKAVSPWSSFKIIVEIENAKVELNKTKAAIEKGKSLTLKATVTPETLEDQSVTWTSSDTKIATVSSSGKVKGVKTGTATITCTSNATGATATCEVTVGSIKIDQTEIVLEKGKTQTLKSTVYPSTLEDKSVAWKSSDTKIATVSSSGEVKGVKTGTATITCTSNATGLKATCKVTVGSIKIDQTEIVIEKGKTQTLKAMVYPSALEDKSVTWTSSDTKIATVSSSGEVKGVKTGTATITCTSNATGLKATCEVTVGSVKIDQSEIALEKGKTQTLKSTVYPSTLEDKSVTWTSSDTKIATVSSSGKVKGVKTGTATITCTSNATGLTATCEVIVGSVKISQTEIVLEKGKNQTLKSTVYPSTLEDKSVTWKSSDKSVATVSSSGKVKGIKAGTATITCTSNATGLSASCTVTVLAVMESRSYEGGIDEIDKSEAVEPFDVYDLSGRKVRHQVTSLDGLPKGIYIVNGKKIMK